MNSPFATRFRKDGSGPLVNPVWGLRFFSAVPLVCVMLALFVFKSGNGHDFLLGAAAGLLLVATVFSSGIAAFEWKQSAHPEKVQDIRFTR